jgi:tetratricopeptide (TPR) repeat protein
MALYQLQRGAPTKALEACNTALSLQTDYAPAMLARGRTLLALNRPADAVIEIQRAANLNPLPEYQWILADALALTGDQRHAAEIDSQLARRADGEDPRALALYLATRHQDVERAVRLAQQELTNRGDVFTHDALAWALAAAGRIAEAQQHALQALAEGTRDPRLYLHAGVIAALANDTQHAKRWLEHAAAMQQMLLPSERVLLEDWRQRAGRQTLRTPTNTQPRLTNLH